MRRTAVGGAPHRSRRRLPKSVANVSAQTSASQPPIKAFWKFLWFSIVSNKATWLIQLDVKTVRSPARLVAIPPQVLRPRGDAHPVYPELATKPSIKQFRHIYPHFFYRQLYQQQSRFSSIPAVIQLSNSPILIPFSSPQNARSYTRAIDLPAVVL
jgi:hypothetical protein